MPALATRLAVPIAQVGVWHAATGVWECTEEQLRDAVLAQHDPAFRSPILKIGHTDGRFTDGALLGDGQPAVGRLENLRLTADGQTLLADLVGVPAWLDEVMASAYPSRSIEAQLDVETGDGHRYAMVVTGLALLGVTAPAIQSLGDIADLYGTTTDLTDWVAARSVAASALTEGDPMPKDRLPRRLGQIVASASIEELCSAFETWAETQPVLGGDAWCRDIYTDHLVATVWRGDEPQYWSVSWTESGGTFTFGTLVQVRPTYEPVPSQAAAASGGVPDTSSTNSVVRLQNEWPIPVQFARGREAIAAAAPPKENRVPLTPALAERLGVSADAEDDAVLAAVDALVQNAQTPAPPVDTDSDTETDETAGDAPADVEALVASAVQRALRPVLASLTAATTELSELKADKQEAARNALIGGAVAAGKIAPKDRALYEAQYATAPDVVSAILGSIAPGTAVPVAAAGHAGAPEVGDMTDAEWSQIASQLGIQVGGE